MIVVTGASGFLGGYLVRSLKRSKARLFLTSRRSAARSGLNYHPVDFDSPRACDSLPKKIDIVIHLASRVPVKDRMIPFEDYMRTNAEGTRRLGEAAASRGCGHFIYASTQMVYDRPLWLPVAEEHPYVTSTDYGLSKAAGEKYILSLGRTSRMKVSVLRFSQLFGAGERPGFVLTQLIEKAAQGNTIELYGKSGPGRDLLYVKDAAAAVLKVMRLREPGIFNIGSGKTCSLRNLAGNILRTFDAGSAHLTVRPDFEEDRTEYRLDTRKAAKTLGFKPAYDLKRALLDYKKELLARKVLS